MDRRFFLGTVAGALAAAQPALADRRSYKHKHSGGASGTGSHLGIGESSFRRGSLEKQYEMPGCVFIVNHAEYVHHDEFEIFDMGAEQYPLWVRSDAPVEQTTIGDIVNHFVSRTPLYSVDGTPASFIRHSKFQGLRLKAFYNVMSSIGVDEGIAENVSIGVDSYKSLLNHGQAENTNLLFGFRRLAPDGLKVLLVDGKHPKEDWEDYPLRSNTFACVRKNSNVGWELFEKFQRFLEKERAIDAANWASA